MARRFCAVLGVAWLCVLSAIAQAQEKTADGPRKSRGDLQRDAYFAAETARLREESLAEIKSADDWKARRPEFRRQLYEMLGLDPLPEKTDLKATITGTLEQDDFTVEKLHFQSRPGLYVTGNLYLPKGLTQPAPAILYVCGHGKVVKDGVSLGNKTHYQHHGAGFARNGYVCLVIDTIQLGELEGLHHGTYNLDLWWWAARGYTPAGAEAWNCIRAIDYLRSRKEVDPERIGVTGRSGGGSYSWWSATADERIKCAVPVAGITDLEDHVVDGTVDGHCDCMFFINTYRWDYPQVAAMIAPRPLLLANTDRDPIFPLDGVVRTYFGARKIYELLGVPDSLALNITAGGHVDTQELQVHAFRWFNYHLKNKDKSLITKNAEPAFKPEELKVFSELPRDELTTKIHETFVPLAEPKEPASESEWQTMREGWRKQLAEKSFRGWPSEPGELNVKPAFSAEKEGIKFSAIDFTSQDNVELRLYLAMPAGLENPDLVVLNVLDHGGYDGQLIATYRTAFEDELKAELAAVPARKPAAADFADLQKMFKSFKWAMAYVAPRGIGLDTWNVGDNGLDEKEHNRLRRRYYLLGQTLEGMQTYDVRRAIQALRTLPAMKETPLWLQSEGSLSGITLYASLFEPNVTRLDLYNLSKSHRDDPPKSDFRIARAPVYLNVLRYLDMPQAVAMAAERSRMVIYQDGDAGWEYPQSVAKTLGWNEKQLQLRKLPQEEDADEGDAKKKK